MSGEAINVISQVTYREDVSDPPEHQSMIGASVGV